MSIKLFFEAIIKIILGILLVGLLIFLPAGTLNYFNGWLLCGILFIPMFIAGIIMMIKSPELLKRRLSAKEKIGASADGKTINEIVNKPQIRELINTYSFAKLVLLMGAENVGKISGIYETGELRDEIYRRSINMDLSDSSESEYSFLS